VVHNGVDCSLFTPSSDRRLTRRALGLDENGFYWVSICHLLRQKGTAELLDAFTRLARISAEARLVVVGSGPELPALRRRLIEQGVGDRVVFAGLRSPEEVARWLQAGDAFVLASHNEGLPNAVLEAMATGLPVVATDVGGTREAVVDAVSGVLVPPRDSDALTTAMVRVTEDHDFAARLGAEGRRRVDRQFAWEVSARAWIEVYEKAMRLSSARPTSMPRAAVGG
jgi:glycosyltransferase involved in cell wall biosynthesis